MIPRVLNESCQGCSSRQIANSNRIIDFMKQNHMSEWSQIDAKYRRGG